MNDESTAHGQAQAQMDSVRAMVAALECDYDRLEELREERDDYDAGGYTSGPELWARENPEDAAELAELEEAAGDCADREDAETRILEDALSVEVRSDWHTVGEEPTPAEFRIVLCMGGPHVEMRGALNEHGEPERAWLMFQDWGTPLTERINQPGDNEALLAYAAVFHFCH